MKKPNKKKDEQIRISHTFDIIIKGKNIDDKAYLEKTIAEDVTRRGVFFCTQQRLIPGSLVRLYSLSEPTKTIAKVEVVWVRKEPTAGVGTKLVGSNRSWMKFLLQNSVTFVEDENKEKLADQTVDSN